MTRAFELRQYPSDELRGRLEEAREELFNLRFQAATGQLENHKQLGILSREVARMMTVLKERELGIDSEPEETPGRRRRGEPKEPRGSEDAAEESDGRRRRRRAAKEEPPEEPSQEGEES